MPKPRLSGAQRRKLARQQEIAAAAANGQQVMPPLRRLETLNTVRDYRREINAVYRDLHHDRIRREDATSRVFILNTGAALARAEQELQELIELRRRLDEIQGRQGALPYTQGDAFDGSGEHEDGELLPTIAATDLPHEVN